MRTAHFKQMLRRLDTLSMAQLDELAKELESRRTTALSYRALDQALGTPCCRHCGSLHVVKNGHAHGLQRYQCCD
jgi:transposase-like protein